MSVKGLGRSTGKEPKSGAKPTTLYLLQRTNALDGEWVCCRRSVRFYCGPPMGTRTMLDPLIANGAPVLSALGTAPGKPEVE
jgi:hypothetical protein